MLIGGWDVPGFEVFIIEVVTFFNLKDLIFAPVAVLRTHTSLVHELHALHGVVFAVERRYLVVAANEVVSDDHLGDASDRRSISFLTVHFYNI